MRLLILSIFCVLLISLPASAGGPARSVDTVEATQSEGYVLTPAYPNPFNPSTTFSLTVDVRQQVAVEVFNLLGQRVDVLFEGMMEEDETRTFTFDGSDLPSGIYLYRVTGSRFVATRHVTLLK